ncbi:hypothetical protein [Xenorhabdus bovienii]|uniref:hypothetical protein n=1 Tax=Xenorhabdus bovienii TaxID=40576 RepID=UPI00237C5A7C|nr:hypothetical protein [Xenorhabdus bovienii]MDE1483066.1 hypothetical protein [Xenorhabdus bovienii]MDE9480564.1 hypothetical protein [Xenorhabdus bovienii]MDE9551961.1 hypothetical protein [Xenorhabdus bovienii]
MSRREFEGAFFDQSLVVDNGIIKPLSLTEDYRRKNYSEIERKYSNMSSDIVTRMCDDEEYYVLLTHGEMVDAVKNSCGSNPNSSWKDNLFSVADVVTTYTGSILDGYAFMRLANELSSNFGVRVTEYINRHGNKMIKLTGHAGVRKFLTATKYRADHWKVIDIGIGTQAMREGIITASRRVIIVSALYRSAELLFRDEYDIYDFFGNITMDVAKTAVGALVGLGVVAGAAIALGAGAFALGVAVVALAVGLLTTWVLSELDDRYKISKKLINYMREKELAEADKLDYRKQPFGYPYPRIK